MGRCCTWAAKDSCSRNKIVPTTCVEINLVELRWSWCAHSNNQSALDVRNVMNGREPTSGVVNRDFAPKSTQSVDPDNESHLTRNRPRWNDEFIKPGTPGHQVIQSSSTLRGQPGIADVKLFQRFHFLEGGQ